MPHPSTSSAYGIWSLNEIRDAVRGENWPLLIPEGAWDLSYAYYQAPEGNAFDASAIELFATVSVNTNVPNITGVFFKPDGTKMYAAEQSTDAVHEYSLSTPFVLSTITHTQSFNVQSEETTLEDIFFKPDGTKMFIIGSASDSIHEYTLSTAWDISTASLTAQFSVSSQDGVPNAVFFKPDGTKMYVTGNLLDGVAEYDLSTAWDVSSASFVHSASTGTNRTGLSFSPDGTKMLVVASTQLQVYTLSTAWDVSTRAIDYNSTLNDTTNAEGMWIDSTGSNLFIADLGANEVQHYLIGGFNTSANAPNPSGITFKPDGTKMYVCDINGDGVYAYNLSTPFDLSTASFSESYSTGNINPRETVFKPDGTKMYVYADGNSDSVYEYDLSTAWDVSAASLNQSVSFTAQEATPSGMTFKPDGTKMYLVGTSTDDVLEYDLSTAWDISTASFNQGFSVQINPLCIQFKSDGTRFFTSHINFGLGQYDLSTPWDVSTASFVQDYSFNARVEGLYVTDAGTKMFAVTANSSTTDDYVWSFNLGVRPE